MRTKTLSANQRIKIGQGLASLMGSEVREVARVLQSVGLTLEVQAVGNGEMALYAARRPVTHDITIELTKPAAKAKVLA